MAYGVGDREQDPGVRCGCLAGRGGEGEGVEHGVEPAGEPLGQYPAVCLAAAVSLAAIRGRHQPGPAARDQADSTASASSSLSISGGMR